MAVTSWVSPSSSPSSFALSWIHQVRQLVEYSPCSKDKVERNPCSGGIGVYIGLDFVCIMFVGHEDWPNSTFIDTPVGDCIHKKITELLRYHARYSSKSFACPIIGCPSKTIDWHCCQYPIHFACFFSPTCVSSTTHVDLVKFVHVFWGIWYALL